MFLSKRTPYLKPFIFRSPHKKYIHSYLKLNYFYHRISLINFKPSYIKLYTIIPICAFFLYTIYTFKTSYAFSDSNKYDVHRFCIKIAQGDYTNVKRYLNEGISSDAKHFYGFSPLHVACAVGHFRIAELLLEHGFNVNERDNSPYKTLDNFTASQFIEARYNTFPNFRPDVDTTGFTPLHYAVAVKNEKIIRLLLKNGADPSLKSENNEIAEDFVANETNDPKSKSIMNALSQKADEILQEKMRKSREYRRNHPLEDFLKARIVGQLSPINYVSSAIRRKQNGWANDDNPLVFLFLGSSGVGKTELAKQLAKNLYPDNPESFIRFDLSEYQSKHEVSKFIGSPPGYMGYEEGGQLTEKLKKNPNAIVLLDEVEKAHPDVLTVMLQLFDEGRITDGRGTTIKCPEAIFVMTSNLAQREIANDADILRQYSEKDTKDIAYGRSSINNVHGKDDKSEPIIVSNEKKNISRRFINEVIFPILYKHFKRDEFIGRINEIIFFLPFNNEELTQLVNIELEKWAEKSKKKHDIELTWKPEVLELLKKGYNPHYGARSIQHEVDRKVINNIAKAYENELIGKGSKLDLICKNGKIALKFDKVEGGKGFFDGWGK